MVPALGMRHRDRQPRPRRRPRRRGERRWGCDASASPGSGRVGDEGALITGGGDDQVTSPTVDLETLPSQARA